MTWKSKQKVMHAYNVTAQIYDERYSEEQERKYKEALKNIELTNSTVLDVGCGSGLLLHMIAPKAEMIIGVDISLELLKKAKNKTRLNKNVFILQADADHLPFHQKFDLVSAFTVIQNMPNPTLTLQELKEATKPGRKIIVTALKKAFQLEKFINLIKDSKMEINELINHDEINCYIAILTT